MARKDKYLEEEMSLEPEVNPNVEHVPPPVIWHSFDSFFSNYSKNNNVNPKWKNAIKLHIEKLGWFNDQSKWENGCKHFGI